MAVIIGISAIVAYGLYTRAAPKEASAVSSEGDGRSEWIDVHHSNDGSVVTFINPPSIRRTGNIVKMWTMLNFTTVQTDGKDTFLSQKDQTEFDCKEERLRRLFSTQMSENMGRGSEVYTNFDPDKWEPVVPNSLGDKVLKIACGKK